MQVDIDEQHTLLIHAEERFDYTSGEELKEHVDHYMTQTLHVSIDFANTSMIDSSGVGALLLVSHSLPEGAPRMSLLNTSGPVRDTMNMCHLNHFFDF